MPRVLANTEEVTRKIPGTKCNLCFSDSVKGKLSAALQLALMVTCTQQDSWFGVTQARVWMVKAINYEKYQPVFQNPTGHVTCWLAWKRMANPSQRSLEFSMEKADNFQSRKIAVFLVSNIYFEPGWVSQKYFWINNCLYNTGMKNSKSKQILLRTRHKSSIDSYIYSCYAIVQKSPYI